MTSVRHPAFLLRFLGAALAFVLLSVPAAAPVLGEVAPKFVRIGTGSTAGTYFPIGSLLANVISNPPGSRECDRGGSCGVPGLIAAAVSTNGSVENVEAVRDGTLDSGLCQADIAFWASAGTGIFANLGAVPELRAIANLYPETVHVVARLGAGIRTVADLRGKRVSIDRAGSGTQVDADLILQAYGIGLDEIEVHELGLGPAIDAMREGELDAFFIVVGAPATALVDLAQTTPITLLPLVGPEIDQLVADYPFFAPALIEAGAYANVAATQTVAVGAQWIVNASADEELIYEMTKALWNPASRKILDSGHPKGQLITVETALHGIAIPLHPGAERYYREQGLLVAPGDEASPETKATDNES